MMDGTREVDDMGLMYSVEHYGMNKDNKAHCIVFI